VHRIETSRWQHTHDFCGEFTSGEKNTRRVLVLTAFMMVMEILGGLKLHSMALFADGCHMGTHVAAFLITVGAYAFARRHSKNARFSFGTGKMAVLGAFTSAIVLGGIALFMAGESVNRLFHPLPIHFNEAIVVACVGLGVNVLSAVLLKDPHSHDAHHGHAHQSESGLPPRPCRCGYLGRGDLGVDRRQIFRVGLARSRHGYGRQRGHRAVGLRLGARYHSDPPG
jgi:Co/Zn/Cd efflux system component